MSRSTTNERLAREIEDRADMALTMRQALLSDQFSLKLQPIIDIATKEPVGAEALLRWNRPGVGEVGPAEFIPITGTHRGHPGHRRMGARTHGRHPEGLAARPVEERRASHASR